MEVIIHEGSFFKEVGILYRKNTWAWFSYDAEADWLIFERTYNQISGMFNESFRRGLSVEHQFFKKMSKDIPKGRCKRLSLVECEYLLALITGDINVLSVSTRSKAFKTACNNLLEKGYIRYKRFSNDYELNLKTKPL